jgi:hypothetical protein
MDSPLFITPRIEEGVPYMRLKPHADIQSLLKQANDLSHVRNSVWRHSRT